MPLRGGHAHHNPGGDRMSSRSTQIVGGPDRQHAWVDAALNALQVKVMNPGGGGGGTQYNEDSPHTTGDTGTMALVVRNDAGGSMVGADGDYAPLQVDATGALRVTGGGGGTQYQEDAAHSSGDTGTLALVVRQDTPGSLVGADGDYAALQVDATGRLRVAIDAAVALSVTQGTSPWVIGDGGGSLTIDGTVAVSSVAGTVAVTQSGAWTVGVNNFPSVYPVNDNGGSLTIDGTVAVSSVTPGTGAAELGKAEDAAHASGDVGVMALAVRNDSDTALAADGDYHPLTVESSGRLKVSLEGTTVGVTQETVPWVIGDGGGSITVDGTVAVTQSTSPWVVGQTTHANLNAQVRLQDRDGSDLLSVLVIDAAAVFPMADTGIVPLAYVTDSPEATGGTWAALRLNESGFLYVTVGGGSVAVTQATSPWVIGDGGGSITIDGSVAVTSVVPGTGATNLGKAEDAAHTSGDVGIMMLAVRDRLPLGAPLTDADGDYNPLVVDSVTGGLAVHLVGSSATQAVSGTLAISSVVAGTGSTHLGKAEDAAHASGHTGVMALAVRNDTVAALAGSNGDYIPFTTDAKGRLWVRNDTFTTRVLSGSTRGRPIQITATASTGTTLHTATTTTGELDRIYIDLTNTSSSAVTVTIEYGTTGAASELDIVVPANATVRALDGVVLGGAATDTVTAYASTGSVVNAVGRVERIPA